MTIAATPTKLSGTTRQVQGKLDLSFEYRAAAQQTRLQIRAQQPPLRVVRAFELDGGGALAHLHNLSGGVLGGDGLELRVTVGSGAWAQLTSPSATRIYRSRGSQLTACQTTTIQVAENGLLEYLGEPLIPFAGARYRQQTTIELGPGAGLFWWETLAPGREAKGELFEYSLFESHLDLWAAGRPLALERLRLEPERGELNSPARLGPYRYLANFYICRVGMAATRWRTLEDELSKIADGLTRPGQSLWGVSSLPADGLLVRTLCQNGREIPPGLLACWKAAKLALYGQVAILPRKIY